MTAIDDFVEKYEGKIDKIKSRPARDGIRGFIMTLDLPAFLLEVVGRSNVEEGLGKALKNPPAASECYTLGFKSYVRLNEEREKDGDVKGFKNIVKRDYPVMVGSGLGFGFTLYTFTIPWLVGGLVDGFNACARYWPTKKTYK